VGVGVSVHNPSFANDPLESLWKMTVPPAGTVPDSLTAAVHALARPTAIELGVQLTEVDVAAVVTVTRVGP
jgi:hypothetical protein